MGIIKQVSRKPSFGDHMSNESFITLLMIGVLFVLFSIAAIFVPNFYQPQNMLNLITNNWFIVIIGIGVTFLLITGNFDLSVGGVIALTGVLAVYFSQTANASQNELANGLGLPYGVAVVLALLGAMSIGALNAFFVVRLKVPSIIVTLGTMMFARGIAQVITQGAQRNTSLPSEFGLVGNLALPGTSIKLSVLIMLILLVIAFIFERRTAAGRRTYLIGANADAARLSGVKVGRHLTVLFIISALLAGITGILLASEFKAGVSSRALGYEFDALVVTLLGGVSIMGGFGSVLGMLVGALILSVVTSAATGLLLSPDWQFTLKAIAVFIAIMAQGFALSRRKS
ncbi:MAG: ABC transporter permease [Anaerolineae bacterium]|nr:ABC transporter permease [Anaerolineae bacterium]MCB0178041.1 ABC transporter permease [Anaerolineae bacterium]MCB0222128.1 ABC transporter permease [Anaerolineae bacterium]MCB9103624.1 ABC transporter permease [Anaerolineales bacterium]